MLESTGTGSHLIASNYQSTGSSACLQTPQMDDFRVDTHWTRFALGPDRARSPDEVDHGAL